MRRFLLVLIVVSATVIAVAAATLLWVQPAGAKRKEVLRAADERIAAKRYAEAEAWLCQQFPNVESRGAEAWLRLGICRSMLGDFEGARDRFARGLKAAPGDDRLLYNQALLYDRMGDKSEAEAALLRLKQAAPYFPEVFYHLGRLAEDRGDLAAAKAYYVEELNLNPASHSAWKRYLLLSQGGGGPASAPAAKAEKTAQP